MLYLTVSVNINFFYYRIYNFIGKCSSNIVETPLKKKESNENQLQQDVSVTVPIPSTSNEETCNYRLFLLFFSCFLSAVCHSNK